MDEGLDHRVREVDGLLERCAIDWSDAAIADPAHDAGRILRDLGPVVLERVLEHGGADSAAAAELRALEHFHARCAVFEDLAYGIETGRAAYVGKSIAALAWLFAPRRA